MNFPKYDTYQNTGEDWLGEIPQHWQLLRTKNIFRLVCEPAPENNNEELLSVYSDIGVKPRRELEERGNKASTTDGYWFVKKGDVIVNKLLAWMGAIGVSDYDGVTSPAYDILRAYKPIDSKFYHYLFRNPICISKLKQHSKGIMEMRLRLYFDEFGNIKIPYPPLEDQKRIVEFLDRKIFEIDQAIAQKQRLIELLQEQKAILINQAVTKGISSNAPMRSSGNEWIGEIPKHWILCRVKHIVRTITKGTTPSTEGKGFSDTGIRYFKAENIFDNQIALEPEFFINERTDYALRRSRIQEGDVLFVIAGATIGKTAVVKENHVPANTNQAVSLIRPNNKVRSGFLHLWLQSNYVENLLRVSSVQSAQPNIAMEDLGNIEIPLPPVEEQDQILKSVVELSTPFSKMLKIQRITIEKLIELKSGLIASAITGKIRI